MTDTDEPKTRWVLTRLLHHAVEYTEEQIAELKSLGLFHRDASGPEDSHDMPAPAAAPPARAPAPAPADSKPAGP